ncbi:hypothetical protein LQE92_12290 [Lacrimispora sp. NSJ-141]|uniref:Uncharacterized protein n=1 Tax=Lientehia hominis TaxID=2897778 RepID=A0AAP2RJH3_9FIRM|nr:hypothetical protein [Lientehia hominis]MCD2493394.1 hypothetical protein [Lientehia hominis]
MPGFRETFEAYGGDYPNTMARFLQNETFYLGLRPLHAAVCAVVEPLRNREERSDYADLYEAIRSEYQNAEKLRQDLMGGN